MEAYYFQQLNKEQQHIYHAILKGVQNLENEFLVPACDREMLYNLFFRIRLDHPEIFWVTGFRYKYYQNSPNFIFIPEYLFKKEKIIEHQKAMNARVEKLVRPAMKFSEWEKEKYVHDFICENVCYDKLKKPYSHEIIGPLGQGVGVCEGICKGSEDSAGCAWSMVRDRSVRQQPGERDQIPAYLEYCQNRRFHLSSGCHL